jgi:hypothetical protein
LFINLHIENDFIIQKITQVKYINSLCSFGHCEYNIITLTFGHCEYNIITLTFGHCEYNIITLRVTLSFHLIMMANILLYVKIAWRDNMLK